jgi:ABC-type branched-subunit amino acid transport system substrate-binding protein
VIGHLDSGTPIPASKIDSDAGITQISPSAMNPRYTLQGFKATFRLAATDAQQRPALAEYARRGPFAKQGKRLGMRAKVFGGDGLCSEDLANLAGSATDTVVCSQAGMAIEKMPGGEQFEAKYTARFTSRSCFTLRSPTTRCTSASMP